MYSEIIAFIFSFLSVVKRRCEPQDHIINLFYFINPIYFILFTFYYCIVNLIDYCELHRASQPPQHIERKRDDKRRPSHYIGRGNRMSDVPLEEQETTARIAKLMAETAKLNRETLFYPVVVTASLTLAAVAVAKVFLN